MANKFHNPKSVALAGKYSLGCEIAPGARDLPCRFAAGEPAADDVDGLGHVGEIAQALGVSQPLCLVLELDLG